MDNTSNIPYVISLSNQKPRILTLVPTDPTSRYKTRQLQVQIVGKSKMIKTVLVNILDVAKDMQVPPSYIGTFMGYEIGAQAKFDVKKPERQQAFISGEHDPKDLSKILVQFIAEVVLCPVCSLPELLINFEQKKVHGKCRACGGNSELPITNEKFKKYIQNHPPSQNAKGGAFAGNKAGSAKKEPTAKKERGKASSKPLKKGKGDNEEDEDDEEEDDGVVWFSDTSEEAARKRREEMVPKALEEKTLEAEVEEFTKALKEGEEVFEKLKELKSRFTLRDVDFMSRLLTAMFGSATDLQAVAKEHQNVLKHYVKSGEDQTTLLNYLETLCGTIKTTLVGKIALVLKDLYDDDLLEEENVFQWYDREEINPTVKDKATPLIKWLREAEEESSEEDEDEEEEEEEEDD